MAIVMVVIGIIISSVTIGRNSMESAENMKAYQKVVVPCVAAVGDAIRNGSSEVNPLYSTDIVLEDGKALECEFKTVKKGDSDIINRVQIKNTNKALKDLIRKNLDGHDITVDGEEIRLFVPGFG